MQHWNELHLSSIWQEKRFLMWIHMPVAGRAYGLTLFRPYQQEDSTFTPHYIPSSNHISSYPEQSIPLIDAFWCLGFEFRARDEPQKATLEVGMFRFPYHFAVVWNIAQYARHFTGVTRFLKVWKRLLRPELCWGLIGLWITMRSMGRWLYTSRPHSMSCW